MLFRLHGATDMVVERANTSTTIRLENMRFEKTQKRTHDQRASRGHRFRDAVPAMRVALPARDDAAAPVSERGAADSSARTTGAVVERKKTETSRPCVCVA